MLSEFKVTSKSEDFTSTTEVTWYGGLKMLEYIRDVVIPKAIKQQKEYDANPTQHFKIKGL